VEMSSYLLEGMKNRCNRNDRHESRELTLRGMISLGNRERCRRATRQSGMLYQREAWIDSRLPFSSCELRITWSRYI
jgi:hypothetical protein